MEEIEGITPGAVGEWFATHVPDVELPLSFTLIAGGRSNLTFRVTDRAGCTWVLRRPPTGRILRTAHDMAREYRVISALGRHTDVPVAPAVALCEDVSVNGAPFYVMGFVDGHVLRDVPAGHVLGVVERLTAGHDLVDVLARIHAVDIDAVGLGGLGRRGGYIERQLRRWYEQYRQSTGGETLPLMDELYRRFLSAIPPQRGTVLVHGDYRLDNALLGGDGRVRAVLDWEICTLGDPLADIGLLLVYWADPGDGSIGPLASPTILEGFPRRAEIAERYALQSGRDLTAVGFYVAFGYWKLACILQGVYERYSGGAGGGDRSGVEAYAGHVERLAELAHAAVGRAA